MAVPAESLVWRIIPERTSDGVCFYQGAKECQCHLRKVKALGPRHRKACQLTRCAGSADLPQPVPNNLLRFTLDFRLTSSAKPRFEQRTHIKVRCPGLHAPLLAGRPPSHPQCACCLILHLCLGAHAPAVHVRGM